MFEMVGGVVVGVGAEVVGVVVVVGMVVVVMVVVLVGAVVMMVVVLVGAVVIMVVVLRGTTLMSMPYVYTCPALSAPAKLKRTTPGASGAVNVRPRLAPLPLLFVTSI
jgi:hypothetical protein